MKNSVLEKERGINNYTQNSINPSFINKFQHLESLYLKKSTLCRNIPELSFSEPSKEIKRKSRKSVLLMTSSTRRSLMDIKRDIFLNTSNQEKNKSTIRKIELSNYTPDQILDVNCILILDFLMISFSLNK